MSFDCNASWWTKSGRAELGDHRRCARLAVVGLACGLLLPAGCYTGSQSVPGFEPVGGSSSSDGGSDEGEPPPQLEPDCTVGRLPARLLTREQVGHMVRDVFAPATLDATPLVDALPKTTVRAGYANNVDALMQTDMMDALVRASEELSAQVREQLGVLSDCEPGPDCARSFAARYGRRAFRRTLSDAEVDELMALYDEAETFEDGIELVTRGIVLSGPSLYMSEQGVAVPEGPRPLSGVELASRLSFLLWNTIPDDALLDAAEAGELNSQEGLSAAIDRLLADERAQEGLASFFRQWLGTSSLGPKPEDDFGPELADSARTAFDRFITYVVQQSDQPTVEELLTARYAFVDPPLAELYGVSTAGGEPFMGGIRVELDPAERSGVLTRAAFLAAHTPVGSSSPTLRGLAVRSALMCQQIPPPPDDDAASISPDMPEGLNEREIVEYHAMEPACAGCHQFTDFVGLGLLNYGPDGRFRTTYEGRGDRRRQRDARADR